MEEVVNMLKLLHEHVEDDRKPLKLELYADMSGEITDEKGARVFNFAHHGDFYNAFYKFLMYSVRN